MSTKLVSPKIATKACQWIMFSNQIDLENKPFYFIGFFDDQTQTIKSWSIGFQEITTQNFIRKLQKSVLNFQKENPEYLLTLYSNERNHIVSSRKYQNFADDNPTVVSSMITDENHFNNDLKKKFIDKFNALQIQGKTLKEELLEKLREDPEVNKNTIESITHKFIDRWNHKGNFSEFERIHDSKNSQTNYIHQVKALEEAVIKYEPEVVEDSPFDFDQIQQWSLMKTQIEDLKNYIQNASDENSETLQLLVEDQTRKLGQQIKDLSGQIDSVSDDVKSLLPKPKRKHEPQELRDPITQETFQVLMINAGSLAKNQKDIRRAQLRITYTVLYYVGLRLNELQPLELQTLQNAIKEKELKITLFKTNRCHNFILSEQAIRALEALEEEFFILTKVYQFKYLFGKRTPIHRKSLLRLVNQDLANTCERYKISGNIKSHSFRISLIARLLKVTYVQQVAEIMGHQDIRSTMKYKRYRVGKDDIRKLYQSAERIN